MLVVFIYNKDKKQLIFLGVINKYSNFVGSPIFVNGKRVNTIQVSPTALSSAVLYN